MEQVSGVVRGADGWLFLSGGSNNAELLYKNPNRFPESSRQAWRRIIHRRRLVAEQLGGQFVHLIAPEKTSIYPEFYPETLPFFGHHPCGYLSGIEFPDCLPHVVNPSGALMQRKLLCDVYARTDSHWTLDAAVLCVNLVLDRLDVDRRLSVGELDVVTRTVVGDLGSKMPDRPSEEKATAAFSADVAVTSRNGIVAYNEAGRGTRPAIHVGASVSLRNAGAAAIPKSVLIFGDSYSGYEAGGLTHLFAEVFGEVSFVWSQNVDIELVRRMAPDILLTQGAERFMLRVPDDRFDLEAHVASRLAELSGGAAAAAS